MKSENKQASFWRFPIFLFLKISTFWGVMLHYRVIAGYVLKDCGAFTFWVKESKIINVGMLDINDKVTMILPNTINYWPNNTVPHPRRPESLTTPVRPSDLTIQFCYELILILFYLILIVCVLSTGNKSKSELEALLLQETDISLTLVYMMSKSCCGERFNGSFSNSAWSRCSFSSNTSTWICTNSLAEFLSLDKMLPKPRPEIQHISHL